MSLLNKVKKALKKNDKLQDSFSCSNIEKNANELQDSISSSNIEKTVEKKKRKKSEFRWILIDRIFDNIDDVMRTMQDENWKISKETNEIFLFKCGQDNKCKASMYRYKIMLLIVCFFF